MSHTPSKTIPHTALGTHVLLDLYGCPAELLSDGPALEQALCAAASVMGATVVGSHFHRFSPYGISGVVIIMESHLTIHTWPEHQYAAIDIFTCGHIALQKGVQHLRDALSATRVQHRTHPRGQYLPKPPQQ